MPAPRRSCDLISTAGGNDSDRSWIRYADAGRFRPLSRERSAWGRDREGERFANPSLYLRIEADPLPKPPPRRFALRERGRIAPGRKSLSDAVGIIQWAG